LASHIARKSKLETESRTNQPENCRHRDCQAKGEKIGVKVNLQRGHKPTPNGVREKSGLWFGSVQRFGPEEKSSPKFEDLLTAERPRVKKSASRETCREATSPHQMVAVRNPSCGSGQSGYEPRNSIFQSRFQDQRL
jgi:hypothetical protein